MQKLKSIDYALDKERKREDMQNVFGNRFKFRRGDFSPTRARSNSIFLLGSLARENNRTDVPLSTDNRSVEEIRKHTGEVFNRIQSMYREINATMIESLETGAEAVLNNLGDPGIERLEQVSPAEWRNDDSRPDHHVFSILSKDELETHKAKILAVAMATNAKARESQEKYAHARAELEVVTEQHRAAEKRLQDVDELREKCRLLEAKLAQETEMRLSAELQLKAMVDELNIDLDIDWNILETNLAKTIELFPDYRCIC